MIFSGSAGPLWILNEANSAYNNDALSHMALCVCRDRVRAFSISAVKVTYTKVAGLVTLYVSPWLRRIPQGRSDELEQNALSAQSELRFEFLGLGNVGKHVNFVQNAAGAADRRSRLLSLISDDGSSGDQRGARQLQTSAHVSASAAEVKQDQERTGAA